ncbi:MAG: DUF6033 family protein [Roseburia sp.]|nr:DUF6033 family protein [Roseburia sp.]
MNFNAWMPLQNTTGKNYNYSAKKEDKTSRTAQKEADKTWRFPTDKYEPSVDAEAYKTKKASSEKTEAAQATRLSKKAQELLKELKEKYGNMDFFVGSYSSTAEAQSYLRRGTKEYSVLIDPETLEEMANDESVRAQYEDVLSGAGDKLAELKDQLGDDADSVKSFGVSIDKEGKVSYFAELDKISESRQKQLESVKAKKAEEKQEAKRKERAEERRERYFVEADSIDALVEKIRNSSKEQETSTGFNVVM